MSELQFWKAWLVAMIYERGGHHEERGDIAQTVILTALLAAGAIAIAIIIVNKFTDKATSIPTG